MNLELIHAIEKMGNVKISVEGENLHVKGDLYLSGCTSLTELPDNLHVEGYLNLRGCTSLTKLPENLHVGGCLRLNRCTSLTALPDNLYVGGDFYFEDCTCLTEIPENLHVRGWFFLEGCVNLKSNEHYVISENIGRSSSKAIYKISTNVIKCGLFSGTLDEFEKRANDVCSSVEGFEQLDEYIELCRSHQLKKI